jgi:hypothetical protein
MRSLATASDVTNEQSSQRFYAARAGDGSFV